jgi:hypothetical protein
MIYHSFHFKVQRNPIPKLFNIVIILALLGSPRFGLFSVKLRVPNVIIVKYMFGLLSWFPKIQVLNPPVISVFCMLMRWLVAWQPSGSWMEARKTGKNQGLGTFQSYSPTSVKGRGTNCEIDHQWPMI